MTLGKWVFEGRMTAELVVIPEGKLGTKGVVHKGILDENLNRFYYSEIDQVIHSGKHIFCFVEEDEK